MFRITRTIKTQTAEEALSALKRFPADEGSVTEIREIVDGGERVINLEELSQMDFEDKEASQVADETAATV